jgi:hypothetical protein
LAISGIVDWIPGCRWGIVDADYGLDRNALAMKQAQSPIHNRKSSIGNQQSAIRQSPIANRQSVDPQSTIDDPQSS